MKKGRKRRDLIVKMVGDAPGFTVDVGADHGHVAFACSAIAVEREPHRRGRQDVVWVICDGLTAFCSVDTAIIAGIGANKICSILQKASCRPHRLILHSPDDPGRLRTWLAENDYRIVDERLVEEAGKLTVVMEARPGPMNDSPLTVFFGPVLLRQPKTSMWLAHFQARLRHYEHRMQVTQGKRPESFADALRHHRFVKGVLDAVGSNNS